MPLQLFEESPRVQNEDATVPEVMAILEIKLSCHCVGLFRERRNFECAPLELFERLTTADIPIAGMRAGGLDPEQDQPAAGGHLACQAHRIEKTCLVRYDMIRRHHDENARGILLRDAQCSNSDSARRVALHRLQNDGARRRPVAFEVLLDQKAMVRIAEDRRLPEAFVGLQPFQGCAEQTYLAPIEA